MNILKIVFANIRKRKGSSITFLVMVILSSFMLFISLSLMVGSRDFYDKKVEELQSPHYSNYMVKNSYKDDFRSYSENYDGVTDVCVLNALICTGSWNMKSGKADSTIILSDISEVNGKSFQKLTVIDEQAAEAKNMIILPISLKSSGFQSGEKISFELNGKIYEFTIIGFFEDTLTGASTTGSYTGYLDTATFSRLKADENFTEYQNLMVRFNESERSNEFQTDFNKMSNLIPSEEFVLTFTAAKSSALMFISIILMILVIFSLIILLIAFIVARFSINSSIEEDIQAIGALKSIGYKNKILRGSQLIQYLLIAVIGSFAGSLVSIFTFEFVGNIVASTSGLLWISGNNIIPALLTILLICGLTFLIIYIATRKYKKITPINALRQGESHHSFKKNKMPLDKYKIPLIFHLGIKRFFKSIKNNITLFIVASLLVFISVFVFSMSYNLNYDKTAMIQMVGLEMAEIWVQTNPEVDINEVNEVILSHDEVNATLLTGSMSCTLDGYESYASCVEDYSKLITNKVVKGRHPELYNEIALGATVANTVNKGLGDTVTMKMHGIEMNYIVVGITQDIGNGGIYSEITEDAMRKQYNEFYMDTIYVYLHDDVNVKDYNNKLNEIYGNQILTADVTEQIDAILNSMGGPFSAISLIMIAVTIIIISFVLFLILNTLIRREKKELGIMKALGYKNRHLAMQILISLFPSLLLGTTLGVVLGGVLTNPLFSVMMSSAGLLSAYFIIPVLPAIFIGLGVLVISIIMLYLISFRLKKISPQKLIVEQ